MAQIGVLTTEFARGTFSATLDAIVARNIGSIQLHLGSAWPDVPRTTSLQRGLHALPAPVDEEFCTAVERGISSHHLDVGAVDGTFNMVDPDRGRRLQGLDRLRALIAAAPRLGTRVVALCTGTRDTSSMWRPHPENRSPDAWRDLVEVMQGAAETAEEHGITLAFEPEVSTVVDSAAGARRLLDEIASPNLTVLIDPANLFHSGELTRMTRQLEEAFDLLGGRIALAHAKDLDQDGAAGHLAAGRGRLDYRLYFRLLEDSGFTGAIVLHQLSGLGDSEIDDCVEFLRRQAPRGFVKPPRAKTGEDDALRNWA